MFRQLVFVRCRVGSPGDTCTQWITRFCHMLLCELLIVDRAQEAGVTQKEHFTLIVQKEATESKTLGITRRY